MRHRMINPTELPVPKGYSHGVISEGGGKVLCISGQIGWDGTGKMVGDDVATQFRQALKNVGSVLKNAGGTPDCILRMTIYVTDKNEYLKQIEAIGGAYRTFVGKHVPAMTLVVVRDLLEPGAKVEVEVTAMVPEKGGVGEFQRHGQGGVMPDSGIRRGPPPGRPGGGRV
ncbi:MAG: RidA family protein [Myxococcota bacterium]